MGVSTDTSGGDFALALSGGPKFIERLNELAAAKNGYEKALTNLDLGRSAVEANDQAARRLADATTQRDAALVALEAEVTKVRNDLNVWVEGIKAENTAAYIAAQAAKNEAEALVVSTAAAHEAAKKSAATAHEAAAILVKDADAQAAEIVAKANKAAAKIVADAEKIKEKAEVEMAAVMATRTKYEEAMQALKGALA